VNVRTEDHANEKITTCGRQQAKKEAAKQHLGREVSLAEVIWFVLGFRYTFCTCDFVHISTLPLENRSAVLQSSWQKTASRPQTAKDLKAVVDRRSQGLPAWRLFTDNQVAHVEDYLKSPYYIDMTSSFNIRPPEMLFFQDLSLYSECFVVVGKQPCSFTDDLRTQLWYDALSRRIKLRAASVAKATAYVMEKFNANTNGQDTAAMEMLNAVFIPASTGDPDTVARFVDLSAVTDLVAVISFVKPWDKIKFLYHLCLSLGHYDTEIDLFCNVNIRLVFEKAGLIPSAAAVDRRHVLDILRQYVLTDLRFHPISARQFGRYLKAAMRTLCDALLDDTLGDYTPCLSNVTLKEQATEILKAKETERKAQLIAALMDDAAISDILPVDLILSTLESPRWQPEIVEVDDISAEAISEQRAALRCCTDAVDKFLTPTCCGLKFPCLVGRAGSGKSHVLKLASAYALSRGLQVQLMSWTSERARKLGGSHLHLVFPLQVSQQRIMCSTSVAYRCLASLDKDPLRKAMIIRTDVFVFEEIGLLSSEYFVALDHVLRILMENSLPWGGKLLMSNGDHRQLKCIGQACLLTYLVRIFSFRHW
jgi:AAA domain